MLLYDYHLSMLCVVVGMYGIMWLGAVWCGWVGCPGVLVVKKWVVPPQDERPTTPGGGTVFYVTDEHHR